jgi:hypothetical protein
MMARALVEVLRQRAHRDGALAAGRRAAAAASSASATTAAAEGNRSANIRQRFGDLPRGARGAVPIVIMAAVASATPGMPVGIAQTRGGNRDAQSEMVGVRLLSRITSLRPFESVRSTGRGNFTLSTSFDTGARFRRTMPR